MNVERYLYNTIQLKGTFTADRDFGTAKDTDLDALKTKMAYIKNIELNGATFDMSGATSAVGLTFAELRIMGTNTIKGFTTNASELVVYNKGNANSEIKLAKSSSLTIQNVTLRPATAEEATTAQKLTLTAPTLDETKDKVTDATNGDYWSAAAKVYNKGAIKLSSACPTTFTKGEKASAITNNLYWEGTAAAN